MPRMPGVTPPIPERQETKPPIIRNGEPISKPKIIRGNTPIYVQDTEVDLKLKVLAEDVAKTYLPLDFTKNSEISESTLNALADTAYIFVDNNGKPVKLLATAVLKEEIAWDDLSEETKQKIQQAIDSSKLIAGSHIKIEDNIISADVGVESLNGKTGHVVLSASDLNVYTKSEVYQKTETYSKSEITTQFEELEVDGGLIV